MLDFAHNTFVSVAFGRGQMTLSELLGGVMTPWIPPRIRHCWYVVRCPAPQLKGRHFAGGRPCRPPWDQRLSEAIENRFSAYKNHYGLTTTVHHESVARVCLCRQPKPVAPPRRRPIYPGAAPALTKLIGATPLLLIELRRGS